MSTVCAERADEYISKQCLVAVKDAALNDKLEQRAINNGVSESMLSVKLANTDNHPRL